MKRTKVAILGAGPAGLGAAWQLVRHDKADVVVFEQREDVGGNAGSFEINGIPVDYGSHRFHPACKPDILKDIQNLLKHDFIERPRHGRIRLRGRWIHFPLKPHDLLLHLPLSFALGVSRDSLLKIFNRNGYASDETFSSVLESGLGKTICADFYFPYALKIWGIPPEEISPIQAYRRVSAGSLTKLARKVLGIVPGLKTPMAGRFYYPRKGYGQISRSIAQEARTLGADIQLHTTVRKIFLGGRNYVEVERDGEINSIEFDHIWSTIPIPILARMIKPPAPARVLEACQCIHYRAMLLIYLVLDQGQFTPYDAHYFPEKVIQLTRLSEPKNYSGSSKPADRTVLCGELPCCAGDLFWQKSDEELAAIMSDSLAACGLPIRSAILKVTTKRLPFAYPIYRKGYEEAFAVLDEWVDSLERVLTFGRQGLFAHDNTHHALAMAYAVVGCLQDSGWFDVSRWHEYRREFANHVVED